MSEQEEKEFTNDVIYLRNPAGKVIAEVKEGTEVRFRNQPHSQTFKVLRVEPATNLVRIDEIVRKGQEPLRNRWRTIDELDVVGSHLSIEAVEEELARMEARAQELLKRKFELENPKDAEPKAEAPPPAETEPELPAGKKGRGR